ncbi:AI-2E family transporter [Pseudopedobacter sp.]|uniref:AI-2E family transporter n=1 Tax=Pseudopedobacter sp. TaxID=1936787 RepID=UPI003341E1B7
MGEYQNREVNPSLSSFIRKVWIVTGILALSIIIIFVLKAAFNVLLMILAASLIAVFFHGLGDVIQRSTGLRRSWSMSLAVGLFLLLAALIFWFMGSTLQTQIDELQSGFPAMIEKVRESLQQTSVGRKILLSISVYDTDKFMNTAKGLFNTGFGVIGTFYIIIFLSVFFTVDPSIYKKGIIKLTPAAGKKEAEIVMQRIGMVLKGWLKGMLLAMPLISILTLTALLLLEVPLALTLAILAGIMNFVPNFGPLIAMVPAVLIGFAISPHTALLIVAIYVVIQAVESNIVTPLVQKRMINLPPALTIMSQVLMGTVSGVLGVLLATPLLAIIIVLVDELYIKKQQELTDENDKASDPRESHLL